MIDAVFLAVFGVVAIVVSSALTRFGTDVWRKERAAAAAREASFRESDGGKSESSRLLTELDIEDDARGDRSAALGSF